MMSPIFLSAFPAALIIAALNDIYEFKIPNWVSIVLFAAYVVAGLGLGAGGAVLIEGLLLGCAALAAGFALFALRIIGGGDAKLLAASAPWIGLSALGSFMVNVALAGAALEAACAQGLGRWAVSLSHDTTHATAVVVATAGRTGR